MYPAVLKHGSYARTAVLSRSLDDDKLDYVPLNNADESTTCVPRDYG